MDPVESPPFTGITVEFPTSSAQTFEFAVACARTFTTFQEFPVGKKSLYRVTVELSQVAALMELVELLKGWRNRAVYLQGQKVLWDSVFGFSWCYARRQAAYQPERYCCGWDEEGQLNIWGCLFAGMPFCRGADWFAWGEWASRSGDWRLDKARITHELQRRLHPVRFCPALRRDLLADALRALPDSVNPARDTNWEFVESWSGDAANGLVMKVRRYGTVEEVVMKGVCPKGREALLDIAKRMRVALPPPR